VYANTGPADGQIAGFVQRNNGRTITIRVNAEGVPTRELNPNFMGPLRSGNGRWGAVTAYARGGVTPAHITRRQMFKYGEPETGGEAFIPRRGNMARSRKILGVAAGWLGMQVAPMASGGITDAAAAARRLPSAGKAAETFGADTTDAFGRAAVSAQGFAATTDATAKTVVGNVAGMSKHLTGQLATMATQSKATTDLWAAGFKSTITAMGTAATVGGKGIQAGLVGQLMGGSSAVTSVTQGYARSLVGALNPVLSGIGNAPIKLPFAKGGQVPGSGNGDIVPAMLTPGEFVVTKDAAKRVGFHRLAALNSGAVQHFANGGPVLNLDAAMQEGNRWVGRPYRMGPADCSMLVSHLYAAALGLPLGRYFTTVNFQSAAGAKALGFAPGPGVFMVGSEGGAGASGHMAATVAGTNFEQTPPAGRKGPGARGALDALFGGNVWHLGGGVYVVANPLGMPGVPATGHGPWVGGTASAGMSHVRNAAQTWTDAHTYVARQTAGSDPGAPQFGVFDRGGMLQPGWTLAFNGTGRPEPVMAHAAAASQPVNVTVTNDFTGAVVGVADLDKRIEDTVHVGVERGLTDASRKFRKV
jgi:hypothetical protein